MASQLTIQASTTTVTTTEGKTRKIEQNLNVLLSGEVRLEVLLCKCEVNGGTARSQSRISDRVTKNIRLCNAVSIFIAVYQVQNLHHRSMYRRLSSVGTCYQGGTGRIRSLVSISCRWTSSRDGRTLCASSKASKGHIQRLHR